MPKFPRDQSAKSRSALRKARELLKLTKQDSEAEEDTSSDCSEEYSHVPLKINIPLLTSLSIDNSNETESHTMEQITADISSLAVMLRELTEKQNQQQSTLNTLLQNNASASRNAPPAPAPAANIENLFKIPDPIKAIPRFDGSRKQLSAWLTTAENTLLVFKDLVSDCQYQIFTTAIINKIEGKAKDIICLAGNPQNFNEVKEILTNALGDRQELTFYKSQLWQNKMTDNMSVHKYYNKCKEICQNIKSLAKQKPKYKDNWEAINAFIEEDALAAFLAGLKEPYFGYAQAACPEDMEAAYAFVCKFRSKESTASNMENFKQSKFHPKKEYKENNNYDSKNPSTYKKISNQLNTKNKTEPPEHDTDSPQPMELGSTRTKLTLNKRQIHNNEVTDDEKSSDSENEEENIDLNFCWVQGRQNTT